MKKTLIALAAMAATGFAASAMAEEVTGPTMLTDTQMDQVVAGVDTGAFWDEQISTWGPTVHCVPSSIGADHVGTGGGRTAIAQNAVCETEFPGGGL